MDIVLVIVSVLLIILTLLQGGKSDGASGAITGWIFSQRLKNVEQKLSYQESH